VLTAGAILDGVVDPDLGVLRSWNWLGYLGQYPEVLRGNVEMHLREDASYDAVRDRAEIEAAAKQVSASTSPAEMIATLITVSRSIASNTNYLGRQQWVCRQSALVTDEIAQLVSGMTSAFEYGILPDKTEGHAWVRAAVSNQTWVVDAYSGFG